MSSISPLRAIIDRLKEKVNAKRKPEPSKPLAKSPKRPKRNRDLH